MLNNVVIVGRLTEDLQVSELEDGKQVTSVVLAVTRNYKNPDGIYETDFIRCTLWNAIAQNTSEFCHSGDVVGIKGRLQSSDYLDENGKKHYVLEVVAEKVTFLSSAKPKDSEDKKTPKKSTKKKTD